MYLYFVVLDSAWQQIYLTFSQRDTSAAGLKKISVFLPELSTEIVFLCTHIFPV